MKKLIYACVALMLCCATPLHADLESHPSTNHNQIKKRSRPITDAPQSVYQNNALLLLMAAVIALACSWDRLFNSSNVTPQTPRNEQPNANNNNQQQ